MKNIKTYEAFFEKSAYNGGDYIIVKDSKDRVYRAKVESYHQLTSLYRIFVFDVYNDYKWVPIKDVIRMMTPEEIEKLRIEIDTDKYNL